MFGNDRNQMRQYFQTCWQKYKAQQPLEPIEAVIAGVVVDHPEYHALIESGETALGKDFTPEDGQTNPFLHMGMHISIREQVQIDRPPGIQETHTKLAAKFGNIHEAEHHMQECLGLILWEAQRGNGIPDERKYLECIRKLL